MEILRNVEAELISTNSVCFVSFLSVYKGVNWRQLFMAPNRIDQCPMKGEEWGGGGGEGERSVAFRLVVVNTARK